MDLVLIKPNSSEWDYMWEWLSKHPINSGIEDPTAAINENEAWQYMGSFKQKNRVVHSFRHRCHPFDNKRKDLTLSGSDSFTEDQIEKTIKLK